VTGANSGIGLAVATELVREGADVVINYVGDEQAALKLVDEIRTEGGHAIAIHADVSNEEQVQAMFRQAINALGTIDILVNNAGLQQDAPIDEMTLGQWNRVIDVNLTGGCVAPYSRQ